jgi:hypothetical protein
VARREDRTNEGADTVIPTTAMHVPACTIHRPLPIAASEGTGENHPSPLPIDPTVSWPLASPQLVSDLDFRLATTAIFARPSECRASVSRFPATAPTELRLARSVDGTGPACR